MRLPLTEGEIAQAQLEKQQALEFLQTLLEDEPTLSEFVCTCAAQFADDPRFAILTDDDLARVILGRVLSDLGEIRTQVYFSLYQETLQTIREFCEDGEESPSPSNVVNSNR